MTTAVTPISTSIGVEITGLTSSQMVDRGVADECLASIERYGVVVYPELGISDPDLVAFSRLLGEVVVAPMGNDPTHPEISAVTFDRTKSTLAAYRAGTFYWHLDGAQDLVPQKATLLTALELDPAGGDTEFANTYAAYEALTSAEKTEIADLRVTHSFAATQSRVHPDATPEQRAGWDRVPTRVHPMVWTRPDGRKSLLVGSTAAEVVGMEPDESRTLLDRLLDWVTQPRFVLRHTWRLGDLVAWDNTGMLHRALPYEPTSPRLLHRTTLVGEHAVA